MTKEPFKEGKFANQTGREKIIILIAGILFILCIVFIALFAKELSRNDDSSSASNTEHPDSKTYIYSDEAQRIKFQEFLKRVQDTYYEYNRNALPWRPHDEENDVFPEELRNRHLPYNATPAYLKAKTDAAFKLFDEINSTVLDENAMTPREVKALEQVKHFLRTVFGAAFDENFYNGDWMLGPNNFCRQAICSISYSIDVYARYVKPKDFEDAEKMIEKIMLNKHSIQQYKANMQLGIRTGMVRSKFNCIAGINAFKQYYKKISSDNNPNEVLSEWFVEHYITAEFSKDLSAEDRRKWIKKYRKTFMQSVNDSLIEGIGKPIVDLINYMERDHIRHCLPRDLASGISELPVDFIYVDGNSTNTRTTKRLPITNEILDGRKAYKNILPYFTTSDITPERINEIGNERLNALYPQVIDLAKNITAKSNETEAVAAFRKILTNQSSFYNDAPFPEIESNGTAHKLCTDMEKARKHCPKRYESLLKWISTCRETMSMLSSKLIPLFYHTGSNITFPNCPIEMFPSFNPSSGVQFFKETEADCTKPAYFGLPFFLENHGPRFSEWSVTAHESWPGHHTQIQSQIEYFRDTYGGVPKWLDDQMSYTFFTEGWGLYAENPVIAQDTDTYKEAPMQRFGMLKWQIWRALRLIVDTGLHYRGMNRTEALWYFSTYAWDDTDFAQKEVTRYQGVPGQATAYMLGQQKLVQLRDYAKAKLNAKFNIQDFHYQILSQGSAPEAYLTKHVKKYVQCSLGKLKGPTCDAILKPPNRSISQTVETEGPPKPPRRHYY